MCVVSARTEKCVVLTKAVAGCVWTGTELGIYARSSTVYLWMELFHITEVGFEFCIDFVEGSIYSSLFSLGCWGFCYPFDCSFLVRLLLPLRFLNGYFKLYLSELIMSMWYKDLETQALKFKWWRCCHSSCPALTLPSFCVCLRPLFSAFPQ